MGLVATWMPAIDWIALAVCLAGIAFGAWSGLGRSFGMLLWLLAALWLARHLAGRVVSWLPNSAAPEDGGAVLTAFLSLTAVILSLPLLARLLAGSDGRKRKGFERGHKPFGALVGLISGLLLLTLLMPLAQRIGPLGRSYSEARAASVVAGVAERMGALFPPAHVEALRVPLEDG